MEYVNALGTCARCGNNMIQVEGNIQCVFCPSSTGGSGLVVKTEDPGHEVLDKLLTKVGVASIPGGKPPLPVKPEAKQNVIASQIEVKNPSIQIGSIENALDILRNLPMPKDLKQFKQISKAIKILESLGA
jgi:hypothetical protein